MRYLLSMGMLVAVVLASPTWAQGENSPCARLLPAVSELKGWKEVSGSYLTGKGEGLTAIYNGGYQLYLDNGVQEAAQKVYQRGDLYVTVTTHTMKDPAAARKFVGYWRNTHRKHKPQSVQMGGVGFWVQADGATTIHWAKGRFWVTVMVMRDDRQAVDAGLSVLGVVARKVR